MHDRLEVASRRGIGEDDRAKLRAIDGPIRRQHVGAEPRSDRRRRFSARRLHAVHERIGIETRNPAPPESLEHVALPRRDSPSQSDFQHHSARLKPSRIVPLG